MGHKWKLRRDQVMGLPTVYTLSAIRWLTAYLAQIIYNHGSLYRKYNTRAKHTRAKKRKQTCDKLFQ